MARKAKAIVLDTWAIMAYLGDEPAGHSVADIIADAHENEIPVLMLVVNLGEVWYITAREASASEADEAVSLIKQLGIELVDADWELTREAAYFKTIAKMSYADCFAAALAKSRKAELVTGDAEFKQVEGQVRVQWL